MKSKFETTIEREEHEFISVDRLRPYRLMLLRPTMHCSYIENIVAKVQLIFNYSSNFTRFTASVRFDTKFRLPRHDTDRKYSSGTLAFAALTTTNNNHVEPRLTTIEHSSVTLRACEIVRMHGVRVWKSE